MTKQWHGLLLRFTRGITRSYLVTRGPTSFLLLLCFHPMAPPHVADEGDGLQIWKFAMNMLNNQSRIADKG